MGRSTQRISEIFLGNREVVRRLTEVSVSAKEEAQVVRARVEAECAYCVVKMKEGRHSLLLRFYTTVVEESR